MMKSNILLLITAAIWGSAFVAQRVGMDYIGPFTYSGIRFLIGGLALIPVALWIKQWQAKKAAARKLAGLELPADHVPSDSTGLIKASLICGIVLFGGVTLQQVAMVYTTAGKGGFITSLYIVLVPLMGLAFKQKAGPGIWLGAFIALAGLYLLSVKSDFTLSYGDFLMLLGAFFWAGHVLVIGWVAPRYDPVVLSILQFLICGVLSMVCAVLFEVIVWADIKLAMNSILYAALMSTAIAYTLQVVAQQNAKPSHAAIIFSSEAMFAVLAGWLILDEVLTARGMWGCALILAGMLISQLLPDLRIRKLTNNVS